MPLRPALGGRHRYGAADAEGSHLPSSHEHTVTSSTPSNTTDLEAIIGIIFYHDGCEGAA